MLLVPITKGRFALSKLFATSNYRVFFSFCSALIWTLDSDYGMGRRETRLRYVNGIFTGPLTAQF